LTLTISLFHFMARIPVVSTSRILSIFLCLLLGGALRSGMAQSDIRYQAGAEKMFSDALALYTRGEYKDAARVFGELLVMFPRSHRETAARVMKGKALLLAGEYGEAERTLASFSEQFPSSSYRADADYTLGLVSLYRQKPERAVEFFLGALRKAEPSNNELRKRIVAALDSTVESFITIPPLQRLIAESPDGEGKELLLLKLGEKQIAAGDIAGATATLDSLKKNYPRSVFVDRHWSLQKKLLEPRAVKIGLLLPLMKRVDASAAKEREVGVGLYEGIQLAYEEFLQRGKATRPVSLEVKDSERDASVAAEAVKELCADPGVICIIGPPYSNAAFAVAYHVNTNGVPMVTPTANANGIAATGPYVFQANPDFRTRARAMAQYAVLKLRMLRLGILSPNETNSKLMAETFAAEVRRLGASVIATEFYEPGATNLMNQLVGLRKKGNEAGAQPFLFFGTSVNKREIARLVRLGVSPKLLDSLLATKAVVNATWLLGDNARELLDAEGIPHRVGDPRVDSLERPVTAIQGLYCPISSSEEIGIVSSQVAFANLQTKILGSGEWNNERELNAHRRYCEGVVFEADTYIDVSDPAYADFVRRFSTRFGKRPSRYAVFGYDVGKSVFSLLEQGALSRVQLRDALEAMPTLQTLHAKLSFGLHRVNPWLHILEYSGGIIRRVDELSAEQP
jgi:ABC-type branched-subunit amino acid transport system substrate-binding protein